MDEHLPMKNLIYSSLLFLFYGPAFAQSPQLATHDGILVLGYVDQGAYLNFTGPNVHANRGHSKFIVGMLPSLRIKRDNGLTQNPLITPSLGVGFTYTYKALAMQLPLYFNSKTATQNGRWHIGIGLGVHFNELKRKVN